MADDLKSLYDVLVGFLNDAIAALPELILALLVLGLFVLAGRIARRLVMGTSSRVVQDRSLQTLFGTLASVAFIVVGCFVAAAILFPGLEAGDLVGVLGLTSVAVGFAFKDIFQNFLAGILILSRRPFRIGDQIRTNDLEGTVQGISFRSTQIKTYDGERVLIPNATIFTNPMTVFTAYGKRRSHFGTGIAYDADIEAARDVMLRAVCSCELVYDEPAPKVRCVEHADSSIVFDILYWTDADRTSVMDARDQVATSVKYALDKAGIEIPFPQRTLHVAEQFLDRTGKLAVRVDRTSRSPDGGNGVRNS